MCEKNNSERLFHHSPSIRQKRRFFTKQKTHLQSRTHCLSDRGVFLWSVCLSVWSRPDLVKTFGPPRSPPPQKNWGRPVSRYGFSAASLILLSRGVYRNPSRQQVLYTLENFSSGLHPAGGLLSGPRNWSLCVKYQRLLELLKRKKIKRHGAVAAMYNCKA